MTRFATILLAVIIAGGVFSQNARADSGLSIVRAIIDGNKCQIFVSGGTRVDVVLAVIQGLGQAEIEAHEVQVGPFQKLPAGCVANGKQALTVYTEAAASDEQGTAFIGITPGVPFITVAAMTQHLNLRGMKDVRMVSEVTVLAQILPEVTDEADAPPSSPNGDDPPAKE